MRLNNRNKVPFWYAQYQATEHGWDNYGSIDGFNATYGKPVKCYGNISPASGRTVIEAFGADTQYSKVIALEDRDTPINETSVLWVNTVPVLEEDGSLSVDANGNYVTPWDHVVKRVARSLPKFGNALIGISEVHVT